MLAHMMLKLLLRQLVALSLLWAGWSANAADLPLACLKTLNVQSRGYELSGQTVSCRLTELRRAHLFSAINSLPETGEIDGQVLAQELLRLEAILANSTQRRDWGSLANAFTGNTLASIGLASCIGPMVPECALAALGKVLSLLGMIDAVNSEAERIEMAGSLQKAIARIRLENQDKKTSSKMLKDRLISEFGMLCNEVRKYCL